ncbi:HET-domain-containing protein [Leucogyrophana mollusca]|uniref:HET-domain-containing protein n=1 Tax=Leucogyrophana mollusca TaxID=85980 RepID=A0ACB8BC13_9AGAM|nr:HET-domain-containing protein [Leucogyrophana mollusca]
MLWDILAEFCGCRSRSKKSDKVDRTKEQNLRRTRSDGDIRNPVEHVEDHPTSTIHSLVCDPCWERLFTHQSFQKVWNDSLCHHLETGGHSGFSYSTTRSEIFKSSVAGCQWCGLLERDYGKVIDPRFTHTVHVATILANESKVTRGCSAPMPEGAKNLQVTINDITLSYLTYTAADNNAASYIPARDCMLQVGSPLSTKIALECMDRCINTHPQCPKPCLTPLPTRVIDCSNPRSPKIVFSYGSHGHYVALSYVWGGPQFCATTTNIHTLVQVGIDLGVLPWTITDAINTTHSLGIRYLWVDALCILQDSDSDKDIEISRMRAVYRDAYVTVIAASASKAADGYLQDRSVQAHTNLPFLCPDGQLGTFSLVHDGYSDAAEPVDKRAWCLQERLLSPRCLIYTSATLQYECQAETANIGGAVCPPNRFHRLPNVTFSPAPLPLTDTNPEILVLEAAWRFVLMDYTRRKLTDPADKLVAFAGVAEHFFAAWGDDYLAGLWRRSLCREILWKRHKSKVLPEPAKYRAPSWSWAATDGDIMAFDGVVGRTSTAFDGVLGRSVRISCDLCEIVGCEVTPQSTRAIFGGVVAGTLRLSAQMLPIERGDRNSRLVDTFDVSSCAECRTWMESDCKEDEFPWSGKAFRPVEIDSDKDEAQRITAFSACVEWLDSVRGKEDKPTFAIPIGWNEVPGERMVVGLLVKRVENECYRRLGYFETKPGLLWHFHNDMARRQTITLV